MTSFVERGGGACRSWIWDQAAGSVVRAGEQYLDDVFIAACSTGRHRFLTGFKNRCTVPPNWTCQIDSAVNYTPTCVFLRSHDITFDPTSVVTSQRFLLSRNIAWSASATLGRLRVLLRCDTPPRRVIRQCSVQCNLCSLYIRDHHGRERVIINLRWTYCWLSLFQSVLFRVLSLYCR